MWIGASWLIVSPCGTEWGRASEPPHTSRGLQRSTISELRSRKANAIVNVVGEYHSCIDPALNYYLKLNSAGTYQFDWFSCVGTHARDRGTYRVVNGSVFLSSSCRGKGKRKGIVIRLIPVRWGPRHYLIYADEIHEFFDVAGTFKYDEANPPRQRFFLRRGDEKKLAKGAPTLSSTARALLAVKLPNNAGFWSSMQGLELDQASNWTEKHPLMHDPDARTPW